MILTDDAMWQALVGCDASYDGRFYYAVKTVGAYCRPSCKSRTPLRKNVLYFASPDDARKAGFRPCRRCRPDMQEYAPALATARRAKELLDAHYYDRGLLAAKMQQLGITPGHLAVIFKRHYGLPPTRYANALRLARAKALLAESAVPIIDVAAAIGFGSLSAFYSFFKKRAGTTPQQYRMQARPPA